MNLKKDVFWKTSVQYCRQLPITISIVIEHILTIAYENLNTFHFKKIYNVFKENSLLIFKYICVIICFLMFKISNIKLLQSFNVAESKNIYYIFRNIFLIKIKAFTLNIYIIDSTRNTRKENKMRFFFHIFQIHLLTHSALLLKTKK